MSGDLVEVSFPGTLVIALVDPDKNNANVASVLVSPYLDGWFVWRLQVCAEYHREGVGRRLMELVFSKTSAPWRLKAEPFLDAPMSVEQLHAWYCRLGFSEPDEEGVQVKEVAR